MRVYGCCKLATGFGDDVACFHRFAALNSDLGSIVCAQHHMAADTMRETEDQPDVGEAMKKRFLYGGVLFVCGS